jgi:hypothetical protein
MAGRASGKRANIGRASERIDASSHTLPVKAVACAHTGVQYISVRSELSSASINRDAFIISGLLLGSFRRAS